MQSKITYARLWHTIKIALAHRFSLSDDKADDSVVDGRIRADVDMRGTNLWVLIFAIFVASIGLNVNSTAVIIGAMLISPLMGPIMGIGYGAGINDFTLIRRAFSSLAFATIVSLGTSTLYFLISPLDTAQSELLARTTPTLWDVLIAFFGGLAGIVALTRKEKSNVIPGVAIATALMPPLCTAGFGLANGNWEFFFGAFYLYTINFVFIALSSFIIVRVFNIAAKKYVDPTLALKAQRTIIVIVFLTLIPSSYLAYKLVGQEIFKSKANDFITKEFSFKNTNVAKIKIDPSSREIKLFLIGEHIPQKELDTIYSRLNSTNLSNATLKIYQNGESEKVNVTTLKTDILADLYQNSQLQISDLKSKLTHIETLEFNMEETALELQTLYPHLDNVILTYNSSTVVLNARSSHPPKSNEIHQMQQWLKMRTKYDKIVIIIQ